MVFVFGSVYVVNYVDRLAYVEPALHPRDEANLIMVDKIFDMLLDSVCQCFIEDFHVNLHEKYSPEKNSFFFNFVCMLYFIKFYLLSLIASLRLD